MESMKRTVLLLCVALFAAILLSSGSSSFVTATSDTEENAPSRSFNTVMDKAVGILSKLKHDISSMATHMVAKMSSSTTNEDTDAVAEAEDKTMLMFYDTYLPDEDEIAVLINDIHESEYDIDLMGKQSYDYDAMIESQLSEMQIPKGNVTVCKECVEKVVYYIGDKVYGKEVEFCKKVMPSPNPSPSAMKFCAFAKENPKAAVILVEMKLHIHPIIMGIKCCYHKGYCTMGMAREVKNIGVLDKFSSSSLGEEEKTSEIKMHNVKRGATIIAREASHVIDEAIASKLSLQKGGNCTQCVTMAVHQLEQLFMTSAETVCKYANKIPNPDVEQFCKLVTTKPHEAFKMLLQEMNLSMQQLKQTALMACQQEGLCQASPVSNKFEASSMSAYRRVQK